ncbi:hypothetical protein PG993_003142 [Apiospora rasikravindrae]|uniref:Uncharacterized protein n=1 Tax=Apiospora rasikravindrae TaxID=990691 RepID=A0ABR1TZ42_9PEZI
MTKSQKIKITINLELPRPFKAKDVQHANIPEPPPPHSVCDAQDTDDSCPYPSHLRPGRHGRHRSNHRRYGSASRGRPVYHDSCTNNHCQYYGRCPKTPNRTDKKRGPGRSARSNASSSPAGSEHRGSSAGSDSRDQAKTETLETPLDEQGDGGRGSSDTKEPAKDTTPETGSMFILDRNDRYTWHAVAGDSGTNLGYY